MGTSKHIFFPAKLGYRNSEVFLVNRKIKFTQFNWHNMAVSGFNLTLLLLVVCFHASVILAQTYDLFEDEPIYQKRGVMSNNRYNWGANGRLNNAFWKRGQILKRAFDFDDY